MEGGFFGFIKRRWALSLGFLVIFWFFIGGVGLLVNISSASESSRLAREHYIRNNIFSLNRDLLDIREDLEDLNFWSAWIMPAELIPGIGDDLKAGRRLLRVSLKVFREIEKYLVFSESPFSLSTNWSFKGLSGEEFRAIQNTLPSSKEFHELFLTLEDASLEIKKIKHAKLSLRIKNNLSVLDAKFDSAILRLKFWDDAWFLTRYLFSDASNKNILVLLVNENELRPGGGIVTAYGVIEVSHNNIDLKEFNDSFNFDKVNTAQNKLRDALITDFYAGAQQARQLLDPVQKTDLVISVNTRFFLDLMNHISSLNAQNKHFADFKIDPKTLVEDLEKEVHFKYISRGLKADEKKEILRSLGLSSLGKGASLGIREWFSLGDFVLRQLEEKNLLMFSPKNELNSEIAQNMRDVGIKKAAFDKLLITDNNVGGGFNKTDRSIEKSFYYEVAEQSDSWKALLSLNYRHLGLKLTKVGVYKDEIKIETSQGSVVKRITLAPGQSKTIKVQFSIPKTKTDQYVLHWAKQPGARDPKVRLRINSLKPIAEVETNLLGQEFSYGTRNYEFTGTLNRDLEWDLKFFR